MTAAVTSLRRRGGRPAPAGRGRGRFQRVGGALAWLAVAFNVFMLVWLIGSSLKTSREIVYNPWSLPTALHFENYANAWVGSNFGQAALNTALVVAASAVTIVAISAPAAYVLSRTASRTSSALTLLFALGIGIPDQLVVIPLFVMMQPIGLTNNLVGLYVVYVASSLPFTVFLLTGFFRSLPGTLEEAAAIDGCSPFTTFRLIMLPLARAGLVTALILNVIGLWNELLFALIFIQDTKKETLSLALLGLLDRMQFTGADWAGLFAGVCIIVLPMLAVYIYFGRRLIEGLSLGGAK